MSSSDVTNVTKYFSTAAEGFTTTLGSTISAGATSVGLNSTSGLTNGNVFVGIIEPGATAQQVFTGTVDVSGSQITNVVWVRGTNVGHAGGVTIVDYVSGAAHNMMTAGILKQHTQAGLHTSITNTGGLSTDTLAASGNATVGGTLGVTGATTLTGAVGGAGYDAKTLANSYKFSAWASGGQVIDNTFSAILQFNTKLFDTGTNYSTSTFKFTAPIAGFYWFTARMDMVTAGNVINLAFLVNATSPFSARGVGVTGASTNISQLLQLSANDFVTVIGFSSGSANVSSGDKSQTYFSGFLVSAT